MYHIQILIVFQVKETQLIHGKTFPVIGSIEVTPKDLMLVRNKEGTKYWIRIFHRLTGDLINEIPSMCNHDFVCLNKHPRHPDSLLESCSACEKVQSLNINTEESVIVHRGSQILRMCAGPDRSLLVVEKGPELYKLDWIEGQSPVAQLIYRKSMPPIRRNRKFLRVCYVECHDILLFTVKGRESDQNYEIIAVKLESEVKQSEIWRLFGHLDGYLIKLESITCDTEGNVYVSDRETNRILKN